MRPIGHLDLVQIATQDHYAIVVAEYDVTWVDLHASNRHRNLTALYQTKKWRNKFTVQHTTRRTRLKFKARARRMKRISGRGG